MLICYILVVNSFYDKMLKLVNLRTKKTQVTSEIILSNIEVWVDDIEAANLGFHRVKGDQFIY